MTYPSDSGNSRRTFLAGAGAALTVAGLSGCMTTSGSGGLTQVGRYDKQIVKVEGLNIAHVDVGEGDPIVFLHGNPTSSYIWRNIIPYAEPYGRCLAPDLVGMGDSSKLRRSGPESYAFAEQAKYLDAFLAKKNATTNVTFVVHDWGSALAFDWARRHPNAVRGIAHMESYFIPPNARFQQTEQARPLFDVYFTPAGERFVLQDNGYVEQVLLASLDGKLKTRDVNAYRKPFLEPGEDRRVVLAWAQQVPFAGKPRETWDIISKYTQWLEETAFPKLFLRADPGSIVQGDIVAYIAAFPNQRQVVIPAGHYIQEDAPDRVGAVLASWLERDLGFAPAEPETRRFLPISLESAKDLFDG